MDDDIMDQIRVDTFQRYLRVQTIGPSKLIGHRRSITEIFASQSSKLANYHTKSLIL